MGMVTIGFAQTCNITLDDILTIDSQENFERVLIENNFQKINAKEEWKKEIGDISKKDTLLLLYGFKGTRKNSYSTEIIGAFGYFPIKSEIDSGNNFNLMFTLTNPEDEDSIYNMLFSEVKRKCTFDKVRHTEDGGSAAFYNCPNASFKGEIGFTMNEEGGFIIIEDYESQDKEDQSSISSNEEEGERKNLDALMGGIGNTDGKTDGLEGNDNQVGDKGKTTGNPNGSGYYGNSVSGENYILLDRKPLSMPKPTFDCNEEGKVYVSISVDQSGKVISAEAGITGTSNSAPCLLTRAKEAALKTRFNSDSKAPAKQKGAIIYDFNLSY